jgi:hypothetical protein
MSAPQTNPTNSVLRSDWTSRLPDADPGNGRPWIDPDYDLLRVGPGGPIGDDGKISAGVFYNVAKYGDTSLTGIDLLNIFDEAIQDAHTAGGGVVVVPPGVYKMPIKQWSDAGNLRACIRVLSNVTLWLSEGAVIIMDDDQLQGTTFGTVIAIAGQNWGVIGTGLILGNTENQDNYSGGYQQNGPNGIFIPGGLECHNGFIGNGDRGYLRIEDCFGNPINGGGSYAQKAINISVIGLATDNVGEGPQLELCQFGRMGNIVSRDSNQVMIGDMIEISNCDDFEVWNLDSQRLNNAAGGSGFDCFASKRVRIKDLKFEGCELRLHDFSGFPPCEDITATGVDINIPSGNGTGVFGVAMASAHSTQSPKRLSVQAKIRGNGVLQYACSIQQAASVANYGGGPYTVDIDVSNAGIIFQCTRAPRLRGSIRGRGYTSFGLDCQSTGFAETENVDWELDVLDLSTSASGIIDLYVNGTSPTGVIHTSSFAIASGASGLRSGSHTPSVGVQDGSSVVLNPFGKSMVVVTAVSFTAIRKRPHDTVIDVYMPNGGTMIHNSTPVADYKRLLLQSGVNATISVGTTIRFIFDSVQDAWIELARFDRTSASFAAFETNVTNTQAFQAGIGAVATPSLSFATDTDTGFYRIAENKVGVAAGGVVHSEFFLDAGLRKTLVRLDASADTNGSTFQFAQGNFRGAHHINAAGTYIIDAWNIGLGWNYPISINPLGGDVLIGITTPIATSPAKLLVLNTLSGAEAGGLAIYNGAPRALNNAIAMRLRTSTAGPGTGAEAKIVAVSTNATAGTGATALQFLTDLQGLGQLIALTLNADRSATFAAGGSFSGPITLGVYTFATVPSASANTGSIIRISDRAQRQAYSDGTDWRFTADDAVIS